MTSENKKSTWKFTTEELRIIRLCLNTCIDDNDLCNVDHTVAKSLAIRIGIAIESSTK